jgi:hypothetical protein
VEGLSCEGSGLNILRHVKVLELSCITIAAEGSKVANETGWKWRKTKGRTEDVHGRAWYARGDDTGMA